MRIGSLFSGAGGLDMAVEAVFGGTTVWHVENDSAASKVLAHHWPGTPNHGDITQMDWEWVEDVDILCGGWPCQPFSMAGKRKGADDDRALWPYLAGAVRLLRPRIIVLENVSAVLGPEFQRAANDLAACGYDIAWTCLRASDVGAPHQRERLFILAPQRRNTHRHNHDAADTSRDGRHERRPQPTRLERGSDAAVSGDGPIDLLPTPRSSDRFGAGLHGDGGLDLRTTVSLLQTPSTADGDGSRKARGGDRSNEPLLPGQAIEMATQWGKYEPAIRRWENLTRPAPAPTEPNRNGNPRLAQAFSEWMMGWPPGWVTTVPGISRNDALRIIDNGGVCPQQAHAAIRYLLTITEAAA